MKSSKNDHPKVEYSTVKPIKILQINNTNEFPALSSSLNPSTHKAAIAPKWGSLFTPQTPHPAHRPSLPPLSIAPTEKMSPNSNLIEEKENILISPITAEGMSILSYETIETAVERDGVNTPWDSPTTKKDREDSVAKNETMDTDATITFPDFIAVDTPDTPQKEPLPPFKFPAAQEAEAEFDLYNASPKIGRAKKMEVEELSEAERHDTPSYIRGGLPLRQVVENDPGRVKHAITHMMNGIVQMKRQLGASEEEIKFIIANHRCALAEIDFLTENERVATLAVERRKAADNEARLRMEKERAIYVENSNPTKFNPSAKPFAPSIFMPSEYMSSAPPFAMQPTIKTPSPLKYSVLHEPGFMVEQSRILPTPYRFHPLLNRSRTWSTHRPSIGQMVPIVSTVPYGLFNTYNQRPLSSIFVRQSQSPLSMIPSQLALDPRTNAEVDLHQESVFGSSPQSSAFGQPQLNRSMAEISLLRTPVPGKTDHKSTPTSPTKELSVDHSFKATSTNTSPRRKNSNFHKTYYQSQVHQQKPQSVKLVIPPTDTADEVQKAVFVLPKSHRHICPSSLAAPDFKCRVPDCLLQEVCPDFTSENGCSFRPPPLSDWPWNYPLRTPATNQAQQCQYVHIPGTCVHSLSYHRGSDSSSEATLENPADADADAATHSHHCPMPNCSTTRFHSWGCGKDWKTGFAVNGTTPAASNYQIQTHQAVGENSWEWRWRTVMEGLRLAHERGDYGCRGGSMPTNAAFPAGHKGGDMSNWGPSIFPTRAKSKNGKSYGRDKERGRLRGGADGGGGSRGGSRAGSHDSRAKMARESSASSA